MIAAESSIIQSVDLTWEGARPAPREGDEEDIENATGKSKENGELTIG